MNFSPWHLLIACALAALLVVLPMGLFLMAIPWLVVVGIAWKFESPRHRGGSTVATYGVVMVLVCVAAVLAPVKTVAYVLDRPLHLPKTDFTLAELDRDNTRNRDWLPGFVTLRSPAEDADQTIHFRTNDLTLREFVQTIESQSDLKHRFHHCGNGSSILFGGDCSFGLLIREPTH